MTNPKIERLLREIAREQDAEEEYLVGHIKQLEQLCKCMYANFSNYAMSHDELGLLSLMDIFTQHMKELGLLDGEKNGQ